MHEFSMAPATPARTVPPTIFTVPELDHLDRLLWLYLALYGPADRAAIAAGVAAEPVALDIALGFLSASNLIAGDAAGRFRAANEYFIKSLTAADPAACPNISNIPGGLMAVDNSPEDVDNSVHNPVDNPLFCGRVKGSSSSNGVDHHDDEKNDLTPSSAKNQKPRGRPRGKVPTDDPEFDRLWLAYPKESGKKQALAEFQKLKKAAADWPALYAEIMAGLDHAKKTDLWSRDQGQYVPDLFRWLKHGRWTDRNRMAMKYQAQELHRPEPAQNGHQAPRGHRDGSALIRPTAEPPATARASDPADFGALEPSPELIAVLRERFLLDAAGLMAADRVTLDASDLLILRRDAVARTVLKPAVLRTQYPAADPYAALQIGRRPPRWRIGRQPAVPDEWETELMLRETETIDTIDRLGARR